MIETTVATPTLERFTAGIARVFARPRACATAIQKTPAHVAFAVAPDERSVCPASGLLTAVAEAGVATVSIQCDGSYSLPKQRGLSVNLLRNFDGREEILAAVRKLSAENFDPEKLTPEILEQHLPTHGLPPVDLLIVTAGSTRISDFLMWQSAYAELLFVKTPWREFGRDCFSAALDDFANRCRKFGGLSGC